MVAGWASGPVAAPAFTLTSQTGQPVALADLRGQPVVLTFLYTSCPDTCPVVLASTAAALRTLAADGEERPAVVVVTVDPDRDTVDRLREVARSWPADWLFLTGSYPRVAGVWQAYGIVVEKRPPAHTSEVRLGYTVLHTTKTVLVDRDGAWRATLGGVWTAPELVAALGATARPAPLVARPAAWLADLVSRCGELAAQPGLVAGLAVALAPGVLLPLWLLSALTGRRRAAVRPGGES